MRQHTYGVNPLTTGDRVRVTRTIDVEGFGRIATCNDVGVVVEDPDDPIWARVLVGDRCGPFAIYDLAESG